MSEIRHSEGPPRPDISWRLLLIALAGLAAMAILIYFLTRGGEAPTEPGEAASSAAQGPTAGNPQVLPPVGPITATATAHVAPTATVAIPDCEEPLMAVFIQPDSVVVHTQPIPTSAATITASADPMDAIRPAGELLAQWSFDEEAGVEVADVSGNENAAVLAHATMRRAEGRSGAALAFENPEDALRPAEDSPLETVLQTPALQRTVALWLKASDVTDTQILYEEGGRDNGIAVRIKDGMLQARVASTAEGETRTAQADYPFSATDEWQHIAVAFNHGTLLLYLNGELVRHVDNVPFVVVGAHADSAVIGTAAGNTAFADETEPAPFRGLLDDVSIFATEYIAPVVTPGAEETATATTAATVSLEATSTTEPTSTRPLPATATPSATVQALQTEAPSATATELAVTPGRSPTDVLVTATGEPGPVTATRASAPLPATSTPVPESATLITPPAGAIQGVPLLDLPFPYDGGNLAFGGSADQFRQACQGTYNAGRITSYYDHLFPLYPAPEAGNITNGREPVDAPYGGQMLPFDGLLRSTGYSGHPGYDFSPLERGKSTTPLYAAADGVVHNVAIHASSGAYYVEILHRTEAFGDFLTRYWHLEPDEHFEAMRTRVGQPITAGERIGTIGNTGWSTGHHLHFEVRCDCNGDGLFGLDETLDPFGFVPSAAFPVDPWEEAAAFVDGKGEMYYHSPSRSRYLWKYPVGASAVMPADGGGQLTQYGGEGGSELCAPDGSVPAGSTVNWSWVADPPPSPGLVGTGHGCALSVIAPDGGQVEQFARPIRITIPFSANDLANVENPAETLAIYWQRPGRDSYERLETMVDLNAGLASAETTYPGACALLGLPNRDLIAPLTLIQVSGPGAGDGAFSGPVTVALASADEDVASSRYSVDGGYTWLPYAEPFVIPGDSESLGVPDTLETEEGVEGLVRGPGRYLVLAASTDSAGNEEYPPAARIIYIEPYVPEKGAERAVTEAPVCKVMEDSLVRLGPETACGAVQTERAGAELTVIGRDEAGLWFQVRTVNGRTGWISASRCESLQADTVRVASQIPASCITPTPTPTATPLPPEGPLAPSGSNSPQTPPEPEPVEPPPFVPRPYP